MPTVKELLIWESMANKIDLSMPESLEFLRYNLKRQKSITKIKRLSRTCSHSMSLQYANKAVKDLKKKFTQPFYFWGEPDEVEQVKTKDKRPQ